MASGKQKPYLPQHAEAPRIYLETTIISYLAAWPSRDRATAARQDLTHAWWANHRWAFDLYSSDLVLREAQRGDPRAARRRVAILKTLRSLEPDSRALDLAEKFVAKLLLPPKAAVDGLHIAICTVHEVDCLLTWNCAHIANPRLQANLAQFLRNRGLSLPRICTPAELLGGSP